ncbi:phosphoesterase [Pragia fontium]|uniref:Phosphoesterase n=1 Tax=Pragia fontium TaxID=82985 RepID=A0ABQ5LI99_9GAMM|nr:phosphatase PAP2 family protein [Pragia fontium]GKX63331.1 phosphoesterase [Pragia fontium]
MIDRKPMLWWDSVPQPLPAAFYIRQIIALTIAAAILCFISLQDQLDFWLTRQWYQPETHSFPLQNNFWLELLNHKLVKFLIVGSAIAGLGWGIYRKNLRLVTVMVLLGLGTAVVGLLKASSIHSCPWSLSEFGGQAIYIRLFGSVSAGVNAGPGQCFPGGHASCGFAVMALFFLFYPEKPKAAWFYWWLGIVLGMAMGFGQMMRGAHFLSHNLWAGWWVWASQVAFYFLITKTLLWLRTR